MAEGIIYGYERAANSICMARQRQRIGECNGAERITGRWTNDRRDLSGKKGVPIGIKIYNQKEKS